MSHDLLSSTTGHKCGFFARPSPPRPYGRGRPFSRISPISRFFLFSSSTLMICSTVSIFFSFLLGECSSFVLVSGTCSVWIMTTIGFQGNRSMSYNQSRKSHIPRTAKCAQDPTDGYQITKEACDAYLEGLDMDVQGAGTAQKIPEIRRAPVLRIVHHIRRRSRRRAGSSNLRIYTFHSRVSDTHHQENMRTREAD